VCLWLPADVRVVPIGGSPRFDRGANFMREPTLPPGKLDIRGPSGLQTETRPGVANPGRWK